jgi:hypothetical protein
MVAGFDCGRAAAAAVMDVPEFLDTLLLYNIKIKSII